MKDIYQVLREKEQAIVRVRRELEAAEPLQPPASAPASPVVNRWPSDTEAHPPNPYQN
jgi:hypothetical protein